MRILNIISNKWLLVITGFFAIEGIASFLYSFVRGHYINFEAILLTVIMLCFFLYLIQKGLKREIFINNIGIPQ